MPATQGKIIPIAVLNAAVAGSALGAHEREAVEHAIAVHARRPGPLIELLHAVQDMLGHIPEAAVPRIADALNLSRAEVHGVISYYPHFRSTPAGRHVLQVCRAEACQSRGADALLAHAGQALGCGSSGHGHEHGTSADGAVTLEPVYCLGLCASSPAVMLDGQPHAHVSANGLDALIAQCRQPEQAGEPVAQPAHAGAGAGAGA
ncbi:formate dehydrogenase subunit gamma, partial [Delftia acidovorans]